MAVVTHRRGKTMTTITTGTSGPQAWKIALVAGAVGLATLVAVNLPQTTSDETGQPVAQTATATLPESVTGFEYNNESTSGQAASPGVTSQYMGNSDELFPYENGQAPQAIPSQAEVDSLAPVITQQFLDGPSSVTQGTTRVAPIPDSIADAQVRAEVAQRTTRVAPIPDSIADAQVRAEVARVASQEPVGVPVEATNARWDALAEAYRNAASGGTISGPYTGDPDPVVSMPADANAEAGTDARWGALHGAYHDGTLESYTVRSDEVSSGPNPADIKFLEAQPAAAQTQQRAPMTNNKPL